MRLAWFAALVNLFGEIDLVYSRVDGMTALWVFGRTFP